MEVESAGVTAQLFFTSGSKFSRIQCFAVWRALISFVFEYFFWRAETLIILVFGEKNGCVPVPHKGLRLLLQKKRQTKQTRNKERFRKIIILDILLRVDFRHIQYSSRMDTVCLEAVRAPVSVASTRCHSRGVGPQMNKFKQVSSDHHQMSLGGGRSPGLMPGGGGR